MSPHSVRIVQGGRAHELRLTLGGLKAVCGRLGTRDPRALAARFRRADAALARDVLDVLLPGVAITDEPAAMQAIAQLFARAFRHD